IVRIEGNATGECCPCGTQDGCSCSGAGCQITCQWNMGEDGFATLCGFEAFKDPESPPKKYRKRELKSDGDRFTVCDVPKVDCEMPELCEAGDAYFDFSGSYPGEIKI